MKIVITDGGWGDFHCVDDDTYDGAPDTEGESSIVGIGRIPYEAFMDWAEQYATEKYLTKEVQHDNNS